MNTKHLSYFLEIAKQRNMNKAAETLFVSQSSLSQYLSRLEKERGTPLFYRQKGNMALTPAGKIYKEYAEKIIELEDNMIYDISSLSTPTHIRVGINSIWCNTMMASITPQFYLQYPDITIEIFEENHIVLKNLIANNDIDISIIATDSIDALQEHGEILRYEEIVFAVSNHNSYFTKNPLPSDGMGETTLVHLIRHFKDDNFIMTKETSSFRGLINSTLSSCGFTPNVVCEISNMSTVRNMIAHNIGVGFIPSSCAELGIGISYYSVTPKLFRINAMLHSRALAYTDAEMYFMDLVRNYHLFKNPIHS